jgi:hypothetical protein
VAREGFEFEKHIPFLSQTVEKYKNLNKISRNFSEKMKV